MTGEKVLFSFVNREAKNRFFLINLTRRHSNVRLWSKEQPILFAFKRNFHVGK